jgi:hypothetical protein
MYGKMKLDNFNQYGCFILKGKPNNFSYYILSIIKITFIRIHFLKCWDLNFIRSILINVQNHNNFETFKEICNLSSNIYHIFCRFWSNLFIFNISRKYLILCYQPFAICVTILSCCTHSNLVFLIFMYFQLNHSSHDNFGYTKFYDQTMANFLYNLNRLQNYNKNLHIYLLLKWLEIIRNNHNDNLFFLYDVIKNNAPSDINLNIKVMDDKMNKNVCHILYTWPLKY